MFMCLFCVWQNNDLINSPGAAAAVSCIDIFIKPLLFSQTQTLQRSAAEDFLDTLLQDPSASPGSPPWSPCITDSSINEDPLTDSSHSPHQVSCTASPAFDMLPFHQTPSSGSQPPINERKSDVTIDLGTTRIRKHINFAWGKFDCSHKETQQTARLTFKVNKEETTK